jgi:hypothetical protein
LKEEQPMDYCGRDNIPLTLFKGGMELKEK